MNLSEISTVLCEWASENPCIVQLFIFGSRAREDYADDSDLDIAVKVSPQEGDHNGLTTWISESGEWEKQLEDRLPCQVDLQYLEQDQTPTIEAGITKSSILIYERP